MSKDIKDFFTRRVTVYPTIKGRKPFRLPGHALRRSFPLLLATVMLVSSCNPRPRFPQNYKKNLTETVDDVNHRKIYDETIDKYHLLEREHEEPLSLEEIEKIIYDSNIPQLNDTNYNHSPENIRNFWEIVKNGIRIINDIPDTEACKKDYMDRAYQMLSQISRDKKTKEVVLESYNNIKSFLWFEEVVKYGEKYDTDDESYDRILGPQVSGFISEKDEVYGRYYQDYEALEKASQQYKGVEAFAKALYESGAQNFILPQDSVEANEISRRMLAEWLEKHDIRDKNLWKFSYAEGGNNKMSIFNERGKEVYATVVVHPEGKRYSGSGYVPVGFGVIHELDHVFQLKPGSNEKPEDNHVRNMDFVRISGYDNDSIFLPELGPTLETIILQDKAYKEMHHIAPKEVVDYGYFYIGRKKINIGELTVWGAEMMEKYPYLSMDRVLREPEVLKQLHVWGMQENMPFYTKVRSESSH